MVMLKSLPAYTLVFDERSNLVDLNKPALQFLKMNSIQEFNDRKSGVFPTHDYINTIIHELKRGKTVRYEKTRLKYTGESQVAVELCACMIRGYRNLFLFQLFEISLSTNSNLVSSSSYTDSSNSDFAIYPVDNTIVNIKSTYSLPTENRTEERQANECLVETRQMKFRKPKYRKLTDIETTVSRLVALNMSVSQIANATNKKDVTIRSIIRRVLEKQRINSREDYAGN